MRRKKKDDEFGHFRKLFEDRSCS